MPDGANLMPAMLAPAHVVGIAVALVDGTIVRLVPVGLVLIHLLLGR
jgi:hypothetical protein